ncbi:hypothetical protein SBP28_001726 [Candidozyma auris]
MEFELNLTADRAVVRESLKGVLWCIFFHRLFGPIAPSSHEFMGVTYPVASNLPDVDSLFDQKIDQLIKKDFGSADSLRQPKVGQLLISFHKNPSKIKKKSSWFGHLKDDVSQETTVWESWRINVNCRPVPPESLSADTSSVHDRGIIFPQLLRLMCLLFHMRLKSTRSLPRNLLRPSTMSRGETTSRRCWINLQVITQNSFIIVNSLFTSHRSQVGAVHPLLSTNKNTLLLVDNSINKA